MIRIRWSVQDAVVLSLVVMVFATTVVRTLNNATIVETSITKSQMATYATNAVTLASRNLSFHSLPSRVSLVKR